MTAVDLDKELIEIAVFKLIMVAYIGSCRQSLHVWVSA